MRILVDQSGRHLRNMGDLAMLRSCVMRLSWQWPEAEIMVITDPTADLAAHVPDAISVRPTSDYQLIRHLPRRYRSRWQAVPYLSGRVSLGRMPPSRPCTSLQAVRAADVVVAAGGGYLTDVFRWHAAGVLGLLSLAQRLGKPTAMFGQGIGPISERKLRAQARAVLPKLAVLSLREGGMSRDLALSLGARPDAVTVTGDDALELVEGDGIPDGDALGINVRLTRYAGVDLAAAALVGDVVVREAVARRAPIVALPVASGEFEDDLRAIRSVLPAGAPDVKVDMRHLNTPRALADSAASCRVIVTGSYHAAVFGLAQGVPAVCITRSAYYDNKFAGLQSFFPGACSVISLDSINFSNRLRAAIDQAWRLPAPLRVAARDATIRQRDAGREAYATFRSAAEKMLQPSLPIAMPD
jgi:colanic acid/amylovoran biosynthesis protein